LAKTIKIRAELDSSGVKKGAAESKSALDSLTGSFGSLAGVIGVAGGTAGLLAALQKFSSMAAESSRITLRTSSQIRSTGADYDELSGNLDKTVRYFSELARVSRDDVRGALGDLTTMTGDYNRAAQLLPIALDLVADGQLTLAQSTQGLSQIMSGNIGTLGRYYPKLREAAAAMDPMATSAERAATLIGVLTNQVSGRAQQVASDYTAEIDGMQNAFKELAIATGQNLNEALRPTAGLLRELGEASNDLEGSKGFNALQFLMQGPGAAAMAPINFAIDQWTELIHTIRGDLEKPEIAAILAGPTDEERMAAFRGGLPRDYKGTPGFRIPVGDQTRLDYINSQNWMADESMRFPRSVIYGGIREGNMGLQPWEQPGFYGKQWAEAPGGPPEDRYKSIDEMADRMRKQFASAVGDSLSLAFQGKGQQALKQFADSLKKMVGDALAASIVEELLGAIPGFGFLKLGARMAR
jgi:hypothetical protein